jgi:Flp pilus assembly protein TadB
MRVSFLFLIVMLIVSACSTPKYTASFTDYSNTQQHVSKNSRAITVQEDTSLPEETLLASNSAIPVESNYAKSMEAISLKASAFKPDKKDRKEAIKKLRSDVKEYVKQQKTLAKKEMYQDFQWDNDLKLAAIFGAAGLVGVLLGGISVVFSIIGGIALIIGVIFFVQWVIRQ